MLSNDNFVTIEIFNERTNSIEEKIIGLQSGMNQKFDKLENLIATEIRFNDQAHEHLQTSVYWGFAIATIVITLVIALVGFMITLAPSFLEIIRSKQQKFVTTEQVQEIVDKAISRAFANTAR